MYYLGTVPVPHSIQAYLSCTPTSLINAADDDEANQTVRSDYVLNGRIYHSIDRHFDRVETGRTLSAFGYHFHTNTFNESAAHTKKDFEERPSSAFGYLSKGLHSKFDDNEKSRLTRNNEFRSLIPRIITSKKHHKNSQKTRFKGKSWDLGISNHSKPATDAHNGSAQCVLQSSPDLLKDNIELSKGTYSLLNHGSGSDSRHFTSLSLSRISSENNFVRGPRFNCETYSPISPNKDDISHKKPRFRKDSSYSVPSSYNVKVCKEYDEILNQLRQDSSSGKREGLLSLQAYLRGIKSLTTNEALVTRDLFNRYFAENNSKVHSLFLDVLSEFIVQYKNELQDWLFILLTRLLHRISSEVLTSAQTKIAMVLDVVRDSYPYDHQFQIITKYIMDNTQSPSLKMKVKLLQYLTGLISLMDLSDFQNTTPIRLAVSRIITWISEPKSPEVRKEAKAVIIALFQLNSAEFSMLLSSVPNSIQEGATRAIQGCLKSGGLERDMAGLSLEHTPNHFTPKQNSPIRKYSNEPYLNRSEPVKLTTEHSLKYHDIDYPIGPSSNDFSAMNIGDEKFDGEYNETPSRLSSSNKNRYAVADTHDMESFSSPILPTNQPANVIDSKVWLSNETSSYNPKQYEDPLLHSAFDDNTTDKIKAVDAADHTDGLHSTDDSQQKLTLLNQIATILSGARDASDSEGIKSSLLELLKLIRCGDEEVIPRLKAILPDVLLQLAHKEATIRCLAARTLREVAASWADAYRGNLNSFIIPLFEAEADKQKEVGKPAEECCKLLSMSLPAEELIPVLTPIIGSADYPINTSAIRMLHDICDHNCQQHVLLKYLNTVVCNLLKAYDHAESSVRKAAVFCLVSVHNLAGADVVTPYFKDLAGSKFKLLNLYIRRSQSANI